MLFAELVATSHAVGATRARSRKVAALAELLSQGTPEELPVVVALLTGEPRQGKIGVGWATISRLAVAPAAHATLEVLDVDGGLDRLAEVAGPGSQAERSGILTDLFGRATTDEQSFLGRLLVGELRHGALAGVVADAVARSAGVPLDAVRRATMMAGDLGVVAVVAHREGTEGLAGVRLRLLQPVQPMLAQTAETVEGALERVGGPASVEWKLDGARIQVHRLHDEVRIFTRNLNEITGRLPGTAELVRSLPAERLVVDGEAVGWGDGDRPEPFQDVISRFSREAEEPDSAAVPLHARFFDILHLDGRDLTDLPLAERLDHLERVVGPWRVPGRITGDPLEAAAVLAEALEQGHEGVMVKAAGSSYEAGRRGAAWHKVKPVHTLDLVVLAAEWGHGRRRGWLSNLHLGARDPGAAPDDPPEVRYVMVGKTFKGLTDELLTWQTERFQELAREASDHVVHLRPELVVEIAVDGVQVSPRYPGGVALRFARVRRYRPDKAPDEADTIGTVQALLPARRP